MALASSSTQLGCGRDIDQVWDHLDRAPDTHELTCAYCRTARADLAGLARATEQLRRDDETNPDQQPSLAVLERILAVARSEVRRGRRLPLDQPDAAGTTANTISEQAVATVVRRVGDRTAQVQIRRCTLTLAPSADPPSGLDDVGGQTSAGTTLAPAPHATAPDAGRVAVAVSLRVSVAHDLAIADTSNRLRAAIIEAVGQEVGMDVTHVDIAVEDLHDA